MLEACKGFVVAGAVLVSAAWLTLTQHWSPFDLFTLPIGPPKILAGTLDHRRSDAPSRRFKPTWCFLSFSFLLCASLPAHAAESTCYGNPSKGRLDAGVQIPKSGPNFGPYSSLGVGIGRTYVHSTIAQIIAAAYASLAQSMPDATYLYGESGWASGGRIKPHRTHQNGLAVDFMVPVLDAEGRSVPLPTSVTNKFGYGIEFNDAGVYDSYTIDFEAIAEHLYEVHRASKERGVDVKRVIFEPGFLPKLYATRRGPFIKAHIHFMQGQAWVRHDEHYHIDFGLRCEPL